MAAARIVEHTSESAPSDESLYTSRIVSCKCSKKCRRPCPVDYGWRFTFHAKIPQLDDVGEFFIRAYVNWTAPRSRKPPVVIGLDEVETILHADADIDIRSAVMRMLRQKYPQCKFALTQVKDMDDRVCKFSIYIHGGICWEEASGAEEPFVPFA